MDDLDAAAGRLPVGQQLRRLFDRKVTEAIGEHGRPRDELLVLVADASPRTSLGPAYACAAILMRLDPAKAFEHDRLARSGRPPSSPCYGG